MLTSAVIPSVFCLRACDILIFMPENVQKPTATANYHAATLGTTPKKKGTASRKDDHCLWFDRSLNLGISILITSLTVSLFYLVFSYFLDLVQGILIDYSDELPQLSLSLSLFFPSFRLSQCRRKLLISVEPTTFPYFTLSPQFP